MVSFTLAAEAEEYRKSVSARDAGVVPELVVPAARDGEAAPVPPLA